MALAKKKWWQSKTIQVAILTGLLGVVVAVQTEFPEVGFLITLKSILDILLRIQTSTAIE